MFFIDYFTVANGHRLHQVRPCSDFKDAHNRLINTGFKLDESQLKDGRIVYTNGQTEAVLVEHVPNDGEVVMMHA